MSFSLAWLIPGRELTAQVLARANPDLLDLLIALSSAIAAAYALARPSLVGAIAGVAIATALVPPLSCIGIALAYGQYLIAKGATLLFFTNMIAIVLGAACTFRLLGVTGSHTEATHRRWVYRMAGVLGVGVLLLLYPLGRSLEETIDRGRPQPRSFPLAKHVDDAIRRFVAQRKDVQMILAARPGTTFDKVDVLIILASQAPLSTTYRDHLRTRSALSTSTSALSSSTSTSSEPVASRAVSDSGGGFSFPSGSRGRYRYRSRGLHCSIYCACAGNVMDTRNATSNDRWMMGANWFFETAIMEATRRLSFETHIVCLDCID